MIASGEEFCKDLPEDADKMPEWWFDVRALAIVSCLFSSFGCYVEILHQLFEKVQRHFTTGVIFIANLLLLVALSMFTKNNTFDFESYQYGWGYILSWVAFIFGVAVIAIGAVASVGVRERFNIQMDEERVGRSSPSSQNEGGKGAVAST